MQDHRSPACWLVACVLIAVAACAHPSHIEVLPGPPAAAFRVLGMVSGQGADEAAAIEHARARAAEMGGDAIIVQHHQNIGPRWIVSARVIQLLGARR